MKNGLGFLLFFSIYLAAFSQRSEGSEKWGIGTITPLINVAILLDQPVDFPTDVEIPIYDQPSGKIMGHLNNPYVVNYQQDFFPCYTPIQDSFSHNISQWDYIMTGYEIGNLIFFDEKSGYVKVLPKTLPKSGWIKLADIAPYNYHITSWHSFFSQEGDGFFENTSGGLNMRSGPSTEFDKILTLEGENYIIYLSGETQGFWTKVSVTHYPVHPCNGGEKGQSWSGWIKFLDDKGFPNIWYHTKGC